MTSWILLVDDEDTIRLSLKARLAASGFKVETAANGEEALEKLKQTKFDLVLLDINMPVMDGITALSIITEQYPQTDVIMLTGFADFTVAVECLKSGAKDYLVKPIDTTELITRLKSFLRTRESERALEIMSNEQVTLFVDDLLGSLAYGTSLIDKMLLGEFGKLTDEQQAYLTYLNEFNKRTLQKIKTMLDIARLKAMRLEVGQIEVDLSKLFSDASLRASIYAHSKGLVFNSVVEPSLPWIHGDRLRLSLAVETILMQAIEHASSDATVSLWVSEEHNEKKMVTATIITSNSKLNTLPDIELLSESFVSLTDRIKGMTTKDLGLALARRYFEIHGGSVHAERSETKGISYICSLPY